MTVVVGLTAPRAPGRLCGSPRKRLAECPVMLVPSNGTGVKQSHHETGR